jgi:hypothetical protein
LTQALCAAAAVLIACALQISNGMFDPLALALVSAAGALAIWAAIRGRALSAPAAAALEAAAGDAKGSSAARFRLATQVLLGAGAALGLCLNLFTSPGDFIGPGRLRGIAWLSALGLVLLAAYLCVHLRASFVRARFAALLVVFAALGLAVAANAPAPSIDVWIFQQHGARALLRGENPYTATYPNIYNAVGSAQFYSPLWLHDGRVVLNPYPPLTLLLSVPAMLAGDVRLLSVAALLAGALLLARLGGRDRTTAELAALFVLFQPRTLFVVEEAWTEPLVFACFTFALLAVARLRGGQRGAVFCGLAIGFFALTKQYTPVLLVPLALAVPPRQRARVSLVALGLVAAVFVPFAIWGPAALWRGVVLAQVMQPLRSDSLSLVALGMRFLPLTPPVAAAGFLAAAAMLALSLRRAVSLPQATLAGAAAFLVFVLLNKQAFCNYEWLAGALLAVAAALHDPPPAPRVALETGPQGGL